MAKKLPDIIEIEYTFTNRLIFGLIIIGAAVAVPRLFHYLGIASVYLPMFIPIMIFAVIEEPRLTIPVSITAPLLSWALVSMPPLPYASLMAFEFVVLSLTVFYFRQKMSPYFAVILGMIATRIFSLSLAFTGTLPILTVPNILSSYPGTLISIATGCIVVKVYEQPK